MKIDYKKKSVNELKALAKKSGLSGYSKLKKKQLVQLIEANIDQVTPSTNENRKPYFGKFWKIYIAGGLFILIGIISHSLNIFNNLSKDKTELKTNSEFESLLLDKTINLKKLLLEIKNEENSSKIEQMLNQTKDVMITIASNEGLNQKFSKQNEIIEKDYNSWISEFEAAKKRESGKYSLNFDKTFNTITLIQNKILAKEK